MGVRRERPPIERAAGSITLRLPDGTLKTMPVNEPRGPVTSDLCCFCGESVEQADAERIRLSARWLEDGQEQTQDWGAHHRCLAERMHPSVSGAGPFFGG